MSSKIEEQIKILKENNLLDEKINDIPLAAPIKDGHKPFLWDHIQNMLNIYKKYQYHFLSIPRDINLTELEKIPDNISFQKRSEVLRWNRLIEYTILFHDLGKITYFFQARMRNKKKFHSLNFEKRLLYHTGLSSFLAYFILFWWPNYYFRKLKPEFDNFNRSSDEGNKNDVNGIFNHNIENVYYKEENPIEYIDLFLIIQAILSHHSGLKHAKELLEFSDSEYLNEKIEFYSNLIFYFFKYLYKSQSISSLLEQDFAKGNQVFSDLMTFFFLHPSKELFKVIWDPRFNKSMINLALENFKTFFSNFTNFGGEFPKSPEEIFFEGVYLTSVLTSIDKWEAKTGRYNNETSDSRVDFDIPRLELHDQAKVDNIIKQINDFLQSNKHSKEVFPLNEYREQFSKYVLNYIIPSIDINRIYTLTAPTGMGKTFNLIIIATAIREKFNDQFGFYPKIIYALPFISIADQLEQIFENTFNLKPQTEKLAVHHSLAILQIDKNSEETDKTYYDEGYLSPYKIKNWYSDIVLTTTVKLFQTLLNYRRMDIPRFQRLRNSIIIIDEYHTIPIKYHLLVKKTFAMLQRIMNITFILATATSPGLLKPNIHADGTIINTNLKVEELTSPGYHKSNWPWPEGWPDEINRYVIRYYPDDIEFKEFKKYCKKYILEHMDKSILIIVNRRKIAKELYTFLKSDISETKITSRPIYHLSRNMAPFHRKIVIETLKKNLSLKNSNENSGDLQKPVLITTQLIEAGVDLSFDLLIRDMAPLSSIIQAAGRVNRNSEKTADNTNELPVIEVRSILINNDNSYGNVYNSVDISTTHDFIQDQFKNRKAYKDKDKNCFYYEFQEKDLRKLYPLYVEILLPNKNRGDNLVKEFSTLNYSYFTEMVHLIEKREITPFLIIFEEEDDIAELMEQYKFEECDIKKTILKSIQELKNQLNKFKKGTRTIFPEIFYNFMVDYYISNNEKSRLKDIERLQIRGHGFEEIYLIPFKNLLNLGKEVQYNHEIGLTFVS